MASEDHSELTSLFSSASTYNTTSTIPGLGSVSGKAIKRIGQAVVNQVDQILARRRLAQIERYFTNRGSGSPLALEDTGKVYDDLLELSRSVYDYRFRTKAFRIVMAEIGSMKADDLAASVIRRGSTMETYLHLSEVLGCLWNKGVGSITENPPPYTVENDDSITKEQELAHLTEGYEAYVSSFPRHLQLFGMPRFFFFSPLVLYLAHVAALGTHEHSRVIFQLDIINFLRTLGLSEPTNQIREALAPRILLYTLMTKLKSSPDSVLYPSIAKYFWRLNSKARDSPQRVLNGLWSWAQKDDNFGQDSVDFKLKVKSSECVDILDKSSSDGLRYVESDEVDISIIGQDTHEIRSWLTKVQARDSGLESHERDSELSAISATTMDSILLSLLDLPSSCWADGEGSLFIGTLESVLLPDSEFRVKVVRVIQAMRDFGYRVSSIQRHLMYNHKSNARTEYLLDLLTRAEADASTISLESEQNIVRSYLVESDIEVTLNLDDRRYRIFAGSMQNLRKPRLHTQIYTPIVVVYVASLSEYDVTGSRSLEARLVNFRRLCESTLPHNVPIVLFLTDKWLFQSKMRRSPIKEHFPSYDGGDDIASGCDYFEQLFATHSHRTFNLNLYMRTIIQGLDAEHIHEVVLDLHQKLSQARRRLLGYPEDDAVSSVLD
ncbi:hypothetical protein VNI00_008144 [Paramarasmius palmivorus]|uniref:Uncharacterized protein n=1 Tax=Paramarasmius palmivorus TaxID=297713 RepID=A0AAW0CZW3_9AGAR